MSKKSTGSTKQRKASQGQLKHRASSEVRKSARAVIRQYGKALKDLEKY